MANGSILKRHNKHYFDISDFDISDFDISDIDISDFDISDIDISDFVVMKDYCSCSKLSWL